MNNNRISRRIKTADIVHCGMFASLMAVGAFIKVMIPLGVWQVTFSLQFFFALLAGFLLGSKRGLAAVGCYLLIGLAGVPVFAHGGGLMYLMKPTFGFLIGFAAAESSAAATVSCTFFALPADGTAVTVSSPASSSAARILSSPRTWGSDS